jgi:hypothetical protein
MVIISQEAVWDVKQTTALLLFSHKKEAGSQSHLRTWWITGNPRQERGLPYEAVYHAFQ